jgi:hypothetical protein
LANPGEEAQIEKEMRETIVKTPSDSNCARCHITQAHGHHPVYEGQPSRPAVHRASTPCCAATASIAESNAAINRPLSRYTVKTCGGCHYDQYQHWQVEIHSALAANLPAKYASDTSCLACHTADGSNVAPQSLAGAPHHNRVGASCESCHGPALNHVHFNKRYVVGPRLGPKLEQAARDSIRKEKPSATCIECHINHRHKEHPPFEKP